MRQGLLFICRCISRICTLSSLWNGMSQFERTLLHFWVCFLVCEVSEFAAASTAGFEFSGLCCRYVSGWEVANQFMGVYHKMGVSDLFVCFCQGCKVWSGCVYMSQDGKTPAVCWCLSQVVWAVYGCMSQDVESLICLGVCPGSEISNLFWVYVPECKDSDVIVSQIPMI